MLKRPGLAGSFRNYFLALEKISGYHEKRLLISHYLTPQLPISLHGGFDAKINLLRINS